ncbi:hypothetical protein [Streptomyces hydrogenans]|nr:hypothetical protein [Streptomyces hydrogenans]
MFDSALLGGPVPYSAVLRLAGDLAVKGMSAEMWLESRAAFSSLVVVCGVHRFELLLTQSAWAYELCHVPGCGSLPLSARSIPYCGESEHLAERSEAELVRMARSWGSDRREDCSRTPAAVDPGYEGDQLLEAAVARGVYFEVADALLVSCYEERHMIEDMHHGLLAMEVSHAMDREELRMSKVALAAAKRIQQVAGGRCACGEQLSPGPQRGVPARFLLTLVRPGLGTLCLIRGAGPAGPVGLTGPAGDAMGQRSLCLAVPGRSSRAGDRHVPGPRRTHPPCV